MSLSLTEVVIQSSMALVGLNDNSTNQQWAAAISAMLVYSSYTLTTSDASKIKNEYFKGANFSDKNDILKRIIQVNQTSKLL